MGTLEADAEPTAGQGTLGQWKQSFPQLEVTPVEGDAEPTPVQYTSEQSRQPSPELPRLEVEPVEDEPRPERYTSEQSRQSSPEFPQLDVTPMKEDAEPTAGQYTQEQSRQSSPEIPLLELRPVGKDSESTSERLVPEQEQPSPKRLRTRVTPVRKNTEPTAERCTSEKSRQLPPELSRLEVGLVEEEEESQPEHPKPAENPLPQSSSSNATSRRSYKFEIPDFLIEGKKPDWRRHPIQLDTTRYDLADYRTPVGSRKKLLPQSKFFEHVMGIPKPQLYMIEVARARGDAVYRWECRSRIVDVFFHLNLDVLKPEKHILPLDKGLTDAETYEEIPESKIYIALDNSMKPLVVRFPAAFDRVWRSKADDILTTTAQNIDKLIAFKAPTKPKCRRHCHNDKWIAENQGYPWATGATARNGIVYLGLWKEQGHNHLPAIPTADSRAEAARTSSMLKDLQFWLGNITDTIGCCFEGVDPVMFRRYKELFRGCQTGAGNRYSVATVAEEFFTLRALLVNTLTEPHVDIEDLDRGYAWLTPFGSYSGGEFCVALLRRKFSFQPGDVIGLRGKELQHFTTKWQGDNRYCLVSTIHGRVV
ncbi:hypothetical protein BZA05DRAFT_409383 [Tricharina praecox]|uniref:uncharacterized protein n=1 Tax=Tricharina praecox TaxID=43433 RepID=UPI00221ECFE1|nr:uncharacterized protein BZA05DRAFT_409383 [Tricharina praecox]KAI5844796.1 hypothetical protein BZA05DRAFT_409383 [Tricharina praecox]